MHLSNHLLSAHTPNKIDDRTFHATIAAHGLYNTQQFVLRLSPVIHKTLASISPGITTNSEVGFETAQAMSTYLHETVHWWQHIGSTYGFFFSLNYPVQSHATYNDLKQLVELDGFKKSVLRQSAELNRRGPSGIGTIAGRANTIVNNHFDLLAFRAFTLGPEAAKDVVENNLFEAVGHAFHMTYTLTLGILGSTIDREFKIIPNPRDWIDGFRDLEQRKVEGHYYGSPVGIWPLGAYEIFEGQARFIQIQYLSYACGHRLSWDAYRKVDMLNGIYIKAFEEFLRLTENEWPANVNDPLLGLFLLVCDIAINPGRGFPFSVDPDYESFIHGVNPGGRFCILCRLIARKHPEMVRAITKYDRTEYEEITTRLCRSAKEYTPLFMAETFSGWFSQSGPLNGLRREYDEYAFEPINYVIRHLLAHFLAFQQDKFQSPEFFCWPGAWMAGERLSERSTLLFERHGALFVDKEEDDSVFPRLQQDRDEVMVQRVFDNFYQNAVVYDLTNQWIASEGPFRYDMSWLAASASKEEMRDYFRKQFKGAFNLDVEVVKLLA